MKDTKLPKPTSNVIGNMASRRPLVLVLLILGALLAVQISVPFTTNSVAAASSSAIPAPTPDQEEIDALVEQLKGLLAEAIEDEETVNSIVEKWEVRALARRTKKQIITALFTDVKAVVKEKETQDAVWESWADVVAEAEAEEPARPAPSRVKLKPTPEETEEEESEAPTAPSPRKVQPTGKAVDVNQPTEKGIDAPLVNGQFVLTDELKRTKVKEMEFFLLGYRMVKVWDSEKHQYKGQNYTIFVPSSPLDPDAEDKVAGIHKAVKTIVDNGFFLPQDLRFYCNPDENTSTQAFKRGPNWVPISYVVLGPKGSPKALSTTAAGFNGFDIRTIRTMHEVGHIIHERQAGDGYWDSSVIVNLQVSRQVSEYGCCNAKEFVAEVFAGIMIGKKWPSNVLAEYRKFRGPTPAVF